MTARLAEHKTSESFREGTRMSQPREEVPDAEEAQEGATAAEAAVGGGATGTTVLAGSYGSHPHKRFSVIPTA
jgi:hypothetical protein